jgi:hypothetical protein
MNPRQVAVSTDKHGRRNTNNARQKKYRLKKAGHVEEGVCPVCAAKYRRQVRCEEFDDVTLRGAARKAELNERDRHYRLLDRFLRIKDYEKAKAAYRQTIMEVHPDHGGDPSLATWIIKAWDDRKKEKGWA